MTKMIAALLLSAPMFSALTATPSLAQTAPPTQPPMRGGMGGHGGGGGLGMLRMADTNGDGVITRAEYIAAVDKRFDRLDVNHDGLLSADEMPQGGRGRGGRGGGEGRDVPPAPPANGSSAGATGTPPAPGMATRPPITRDQYRAGALRRFDRLDTNRDGRIDQAEMTAAEAMRPGRGGGMGGGRNGGAGGGGQMGYAPPGDQ